MTKRKITPERREQRKILLEMLQNAGINDVQGVQDLFKEMVSTVLENGLEAELEDELGYIKYDYRNKDTDNSRNGYSEKTIKTSFGEMDIAVPRDRKGNLNHEFCIPTDFKDNVNGILMNDYLMKKLLNEGF